jgi:hypothetical protein
MWKGDVRPFREFRSWQAYVTDWRMPQTIGRLVYAARINCAAYGSDGGKPAQSPRDGNMLWFALRRPYNSALAKSAR